MFLKRVLFIAALSMVSTLGLHSENISHSEVERALAKLDHELDLRDSYIDLRISLIDSLKDSQKDKLSDRRLMTLNMELGDAYSGYNTDSALNYYQAGALIADRIGDQLSKELFVFKRATLLPLAGFTEEAQSVFESVNPEILPDSLKPFYYESGRQLYSYLMAFYRNYPETAAKWQAVSDNFRELYLANSNPESPLHRLNRAETMFDAGQYSAAKTMLTDLMSELPDNSNLYARASHILASIAKIKGNDDEEIYYLVMSAMADIKGAVLEVMSLQELGVKMSEKRSINRAYNYLSAALSNAVECHAVMRITQASESLPLIQKAHVDQINNSRTKIFMFIVLLGVILLGLMALLFYLHRQMKQMAALQNHLRTANSVKEVYISQFLRLCSIYIDKLNQFCKIANRKISAGQVDELYKITKSGKLVEEQSQEFYQLFDDAFLHIYPTFVEDVNKLLKEKIVLKEGEALNNDLRILAFLRLGLEDTNQVAQILNYSVNTIYAYRNKLRNRAFDRDTFEQDIMKISSI